MQATQNVLILIKKRCNMTVAQNVKIEFFAVLKYVKNKIVR